LFLYFIYKYIITVSYMQATYTMNMFTLQILLLLSIWYLHIINLLKVCISVNEQVRHILNVVDITAQYCCKSVTWTFTTLMQWCKNSVSDKHWICLQTVAEMFVFKLSQLLLELLVQKCTTSLQFLFNFYLCVQQSTVLHNMVR